MLSPIDSSLQSMDLFWNKGEPQDALRVCSVFGNEKAFAEQLALIAGRNFIFE